MALALLAIIGRGGSIQAQVAWQGYAKNAQHTAKSDVSAQGLSRIVWQTPVDLQPQYDGNDLFIHYGSAVITTANTVIVPVKTGVDEGFELQARSGVDGTLLWRQTTDYTLPPHGWTPSYSPTLTPQGRIYWAAAAGTLNYRSNLDAPGTVTPRHVNFYVTRRHRFISPNVQISTPLTSDANGTIYFGYGVNGPAPKALGRGGIARVDANGKGSFTTLEAATLGSVNQLQVVLNCAPALSSDGRTLYVAAHGTSFIRNGMNGYLFALDSNTLQVKNKVLLLDPKSGEPAELSDAGTASPTVGPDGTVFFGVLESPFETGKGWLLQFNSDLSLSSGVPGAFGWDDTASIDPASAVPSYTGSSSYLLMTKYNDYAGAGGSGLNRIAILDPNASETDPRTEMTVMKEVLTIVGQTPDADFSGEHPGAVREWCINSAVVDPASHSVLANSEDGRLYRWDLVTNTFTESITLTEGIGEAYTPTVIGADGKVYAINNATLFAVGL
ncbi:MAG: hypothetical protein JWO45_1852 [Spartobacteria bacterium]|nr:hypothetical protein [Spartobacteria bacterium]